MQKYLKTQHFCPVHQEPSNLICLEEDCQFKGIICAHCEYVQHHHPVKSLKVIIQQIINDVQSAENNLGALAQIDQIYYEILNNLDRIKNKEHAKLIGQSIKLYYQDLCQKLINRHKSSKLILNKSDISIKQLNRFLLNYDFIPEEQKKQNVSNFQFYLQTKLQNFRTNLKQFIESIQNEDSFDKIMSIFIIENQKKIKYWFNHEKMHKQIILVDSSNVKIKDGYSYRVALLDPPIRKQMRKTPKRSCTFKIVVATAMVGVGLCYKKKVQDLNYVFSAYSAHGCYFIASNGYTYNQYDKNFNSQMKNWTFGADTVIRVNIIPEEKKIQFKKQGQEMFEYSYQQEPDYEMNFAVMMCSANQSVQIIYK